MNNGQENKCRDTFFTFLSISFLLFVFLLSALSLNIQQLQTLSMPRTSDNQVCLFPTPYLQVSVPEYTNRKCVQFCSYPQQPDLSLGGICLSDQKQYILRQIGQFQNLSSKMRILEKFKIIGISIAICALACFVYSLFLICMGLKIIKATIIICILAFSASIYLVHDKFEWLVGFSVCFFLYILYLIRQLFCYETQDYILERQQENQGQRGNEKSTKVLPTIIFILMLGVCLTLLFLQYLAMISSQEQSWQPELFYGQINYLNWKQILVFVHTFFVFHQLYAIYQYILGGHYSLISQSTESERFCFHLGSICRLAWIRFIFFVPLTVLKFLKPSQQEKCSSCCHCLCGCLFNIVRKYSLPVLPYMYITKSSDSLSQAAQKLHIEWHQHRESDKGSVYQVSTSLAFSLLSAIAFIVQQILKWKQFQYQITDLSAIIVLVVIGTWVSSFCMGTWVLKFIGKQLNTICIENRKLD